MTAMHMNEEQRFYKPGALNTRVEFQKTEKMMRETLHLAKIARIQEHQKNVVSMIDEKALRDTIYDKKHIQNRIARLEDYEKVLA